MENSVLTLEKAAMERWRNGDPMGFVEITAEDICYVDPGLTRPIIGLDAYRAAMQSIIGKIHYDRSDFIDPREVVVDDAALLTYNYRSLTLDPADNITSQTPWNTTEVYFRRQGSWRIVHSHWSYIHHKVPSSVEVPLPVPSTPVEYDGLLAELMRLESAAMQRWRKGDPWGFLELYSPDMTYMDTGTPQRINGMDAMAELYKGLEGKIFYDVMDFIEPRVQVCGDMAVLFYRFLSTVLNPDGSVASRVPWNSTEIYQRIGGSWKIIHNHWSHIRGERY